MKKLFNIFVIIAVFSFVFTTAGCNISTSSTPKEPEKEQAVKEAPAEETPEVPEETPEEPVDPYEIPLTLEAIEAGEIVITNPSKFLELQYTLNGGAKTPVTIIAATEETEETATIQFRAEDKICLFAKGSNNDDSEYMNIKCSADCYIYGNVMSLLNFEDFRDKKEITKKRCFNSLFASNKHIKNHPTKEILLPATTLSLACYIGMFSGTLITKAPSLPARSLTNNCYRWMFSNCEKLSVPPELPAENLKTDCYYGMFHGCKNLKIAPDLPAKNLGAYCYAYMFAGCTALETAPDLLATTLTAYCYSFMFSDCKNLTKAPELPAPILEESCYLSMFYNCTKLNYIKCLAKEISCDPDSRPLEWIISNWCSGWLQDVSSTGTFVKAKEMDAWTKNSSSGIPSGWTIQDAQED